MVSQEFVPNSVLGDIITCSLADSWEAQMAGRDSLDQYSGVADAVGFLPVVDVVVGSGVGLEPVAEVNRWS